MIKHTQIASIITAVFGLALVSLPAHANVEGACKEDMKKLCADVKPGEGRLKDCMKQHQSELSQACKDDMAEGKEKMKEMRAELKEACKQDLQQFCANVTPGEGREFACLKAYSDKISAGCKEKMPSHKGMHHGGHKGSHEKSTTPPTGK